MLLYSPCGQLLDCGKGKEYNISADLKSYKCVTTKGKWESSREKLDYALLSP